MMKARVDLYLHGLFISKNFLGGEFHKNILPRDINRVYYEREISNHCKKDGGKIMIIMIITAIASLMTLDYIDTKEAEKSAKLYEVIEYKEDNDEN